MPSPGVVSFSCWRVELNMMVFVLSYFILLTAKQFTLGGGEELEV